MEIHTGASSILFLPSARFAGSYQVEVSITQFDPQRRNEGYGLFFFGNELGGERRSYTYFLIRQDGATLLKRLVSDRTLVVRDWELGGGVRSWAAREVGSDRVNNVIVLDVTDDESCLSVNRAVIECVPRDEGELDGLIGLRVNHGLRLRVERFVVRQGPHYPDHVSSTSPATGETLPHLR